MSIGTFSPAARLGRWVSRTLLAVAGLLQLGAVAAQEPQRHALLVDVGDYLRINDLEGPPHDLVALSDVLQRRWGFRPEAIKTLVDAQASCANILAELAALERRNLPGDELPLPHGSGAFIPADLDPKAGSVMDQLIIGRRDLVPLISALERAGRKIWAISDSCFSGQQVRSLNFGKASSLSARMIPLRAGTAAAVLPPYPYRSTAYLAASAEGETAADIPTELLPRMSTLDGKPHGAFTDALLRVLEGQLQADFNSDGLLSLNEVYRATHDFMARRAYGPTPQHLPMVGDDAEGLGDRPLLSVRGVVSAQWPPGDGPLRQWVDRDAQKLLPRVFTLPDVRWVGDNGEPEFLLVKVKQQHLALATPSAVVLALLPLADTARLGAQLWIKRLRGLAEQHRRGALALEVDPPQYGGKLLVGSKFCFVIWPDRQAILLLNIKADDNVSVLYPFLPQEDAPIAGGRVLTAPEGEDPIAAHKPVSLDRQMAFAFDEPPPCCCSRCRRCPAASPLPHRT